MLLWSRADNMLAVSCQNEHKIASWLPPTSKIKTTLPNSLNTMNLSAKKEDKSEKDHASAPCNICTRREVNPYIQNTCNSTLQQQKNATHTSIVYFC